MHEPNLILRLVPCEVSLPKRSIARDSILESVKVSRPEKTQCLRLGFVLVEPSHVPA